MRSVRISIPSACLLAAVTLVLAGPVAADDPPYHEQIIDHLRTDPDVILPWLPPGVQDIATMYNRETPIPPQCYTDSNGVHNPCYVCHQNEIPGRENTKNDRDLQEAYSFSDEGLTNHWLNLFEDRSAQVAAIPDAEILDWIDDDNYSALPQRLTNAGFAGWIPDLDGLENGAAAFDSEGFALDGSWWVAFKYKPMSSTFWPTQGSTDDVMIRLPPTFWKTTAGVDSREVYKANLALVEANIKGYPTVGSLPIDETEVGEDVNGDGQLTANVTQVTTVGRARYVGQANNIELIPFVYPKDTEFLHTVRYVGVNPDGTVYVPRRMKEVRYMKRRIQSRHFQLHHYYEEENLEKEQGSLPTYQNFGHDGLSSNFGWNVTGFLENKEGNLRWNTFEENVFCMGCHTSIGSTIDKTFSFPRKIDGAAGWGYIDLNGMRDAPTVGETEGEVHTYMRRVGGGTEFRSNPELEARFYLPDGSVNTVALASVHDVAGMIAPSAARAIQLNKAYKAIVQEQDFIYGRDATVTPPSRVLAAVDNDTSPTLPEERQFDWNILLDWNTAAASACNYQGNVDFGPLTDAHEMTLRGSGAGEYDHICAAGSVALAGDLQVLLGDGHQPQTGEGYTLIEAGTLVGNFNNVQLPPLPPARVFRIVQTTTSLSLLVEADTDGDGLSDTLEAGTGTDPSDADSDDDGLADGAEDANRNGSVDSGETDPRVADTDADGIQDGTEQGVVSGVADPDGAGGPMLGTDPGEFVPDADPATMTSATNPDSDGDGANDGVEDPNHNGRYEPELGEFNPNDANSQPLAGESRQVPISPWAQLLLAVLLAGVARYRMPRRSAN